MDIETTPDETLSAENDDHQDPKRSLVLQGSSFYSSTFNFQFGRREMTGTRLFFYADGTPMVFLGPEQLTKDNIISEFRESKVSKISEIQEMQEMLEPRITEVSESLEPTSFESPAISSTEIKVIPKTRETPTETSWMKDWLLWLLGSVPDSAWYDWSSKLLQLRRDRIAKKLIKQEKTDRDTTGIVIPRGENVTAEIFSKYAKVVQVEKNVKDPEGDRLNFLEKITEIYFGLDYGIITNNDAILNQGAYDLYVLGRYFEQYFPQDVEILNWLKKLAIRVHWKSSTVSICGYDIPQCNYAFWGDAYAYCLTANQREELIIGISSHLIALINLERFKHGLQDFDVSSSKEILCESDPQEAINTLSSGNAEIIETLQRFLPNINLYRAFYEQRSAFDKCEYTIVSFSTRQNDPSPYTVSFL